jgi:hypothetical protein
VSGSGRQEAKISSFTMAVDTRRPLARQERITLSRPSTMEIVVNRARGFQTLGQFLPVTNSRPAWASHPMPFATALP